MAAWLALVVSTLGLIVTIIAQRDELSGLVADFRLWRREREARKTLRQAIARSNSRLEPQEDKRAKASIKNYYLLLFLPLVICSGIASILDVKTIQGMIIVGTVPFAVLLIVTFVGMTIEEIKAKTMKWYYWFVICLFVGGSAIFGALWSGITFLVMETGLPLLWSGIISSAIAPILLWLGQYYVPNSSSAN